MSAEEIASGKVRLKHFITERRHKAALTEMELDSSGDPVVFPGNVVEVTAKSGKSVLVSLWVRLIGAGAGAGPVGEDVDMAEESRVNCTPGMKVAVAVAEPVVRADAVVSHRPRLRSRPCCTYPRSDTW